MSSRLCAENRKTHVPWNQAVGLEDAKIVWRLLDLVRYKAHSRCGTDNMRNNKPEFASQIASVNSFAQRLALVN
jgi:hypothetical protein